MAEYKTNMIYVCAGPFEDAIAFYGAADFMNSTVIDGMLYEEDPNDI